DGVGTKLMIAQALNMHSGVGFDLVGMCVNDVATTGARPLFFLDYIATGKLQTGVLTNVVKSIVAACGQSGYALVGGETAEMPGMYDAGEYDLAGFCVGVVNKKDIIDGSRIKKGDIILGLESSGPHSNGYSLIRKVFSLRQIKRLKHSLLAPTLLYTQPLLAVQEKITLKGIAHITGGAYEDKVSRIIPKGLCAFIAKNSWQVPDIFKLIQKKGGIKDSEMYRVFNMGIGMIVVVNPEHAKDACRILKAFGIKAFVIGQIAKGQSRVKLI
ncbi:MAG: phosphoribosylformylglycinamidine cyclo-ligase, partial [Candidatus Omnitrophica bacterium]|nr:phosphoribosylformylglycinamidine cyclo-ligase [Candidatus Omnitrophota bacterium]